MAKTTIPRITTGTVHSPSILAEATLTLALPKVGLFEKRVVPHRGKLYLGDISVPPSLYAEPGLNIKVDPALFSESDVLRIT